MARGPQSGESQTLLRTKALAREFKAAQREFICVELDLAMTFCEIAASTRDPRKAKRNRLNAEEARDAAARILKQNNLSAADEREVQAKMRHLQSLLAELGPN